jgi:hypothetical protein
MELVRHFPERTKGTKNIIHSGRSLGRLRIRTNVMCNSIHLKMYLTVDMIGGRNRYPGSHCIGGDRRSVLITMVRDQY